MPRIKKDNQYRKRAEATNAFQRKESQSSRNCGPIPPRVDDVRHAQGSGDLEFFLRTYFPSAFYLPWSEDHRRVIAKAQEAVISGGLFGYAMPRGSGKTTIAECTSLWAVMTGRRQFVLFIGSDEASAAQSLENLKVELESNDLLAEDFPEVCHPIRALDGISHRCAGQLLGVERTHIGWTAKEIVLPTVPGSVASGAIIKATGLTGRIRGMSYTRPDGGKARPSLVILDDPQTDESAKSPSQIAQREAILSGAVLGLAGPGKKIAGIMPCTVIAQDDLASRLLDRERHPEWQGEKAKMLNAFPTNEAIWEQYKQVREDSLRAGNGITQATTFYVANREAMDKGAAVAWPARFNPDEVSAIQHAMNLRYNDERAFFAEYQNEPLVNDAERDLLTADEIAAKTNGHPRGRVPVGGEYLTAFIDIQGKVLYWCVAAWGTDFTGWVLDYGAFPDQKRPYFTLVDAKRTLAREFPGAAQEGQIYQGLERLVAALMGREWKREDGGVSKIGRMLIDANWGESTETIYSFCRVSPFAAMLTPSHGKFIGAASTPFAQYQRKKGEVLGHHWWMPTIKHRKIRHVMIDTNFWKSFVQTRWRVILGDNGGLSLFGREPDERRIVAADHRMFADQVTAEYRVTTAGRGMRIDEWKLKPGRPDNHLLDAIVGCACGASMMGVKIEELQRKTAKEAAATKPVPRPRVKYI